MSYEESANKLIDSANEPKKFWRIIKGLIVLSACGICVIVAWHYFSQNEERQPTLKQHGNHNQGTGTNNGTMLQQNQ